MLKCFDTKALVSKALSALVPLALLGCSSIPLAPSEAFAQSSGDQSASSQSTMDSQLMYELMIAELAGRRGQLDVALAGYLSASERTDDSRVSERATRLAMFGRQWGEAEKAAQRWIDLDPDNTEAPQILGQALLRLNDTDGAVQLYVEMVNDADDKHQVLRNIQFELQRNENPVVAVTIMQQLVQRFPDQSEAHLGLARALITDNKAAEALAATGRALEIDPGNTESLLLNAQILGGTGRADEAFTSLEGALQANPDNAELRLGYARLLVETGRYDDVGEQLAHLHEASGDDPDTLLTISLLALEARRIDQARTYLSDLLSSGAHQDQANFYLARISDDQKQYEQAIAFYDSVSQGDLSVTAKLRAAELAALAGDLDEGRSRLSELSALVPNPALQPRVVMTESRMLQSANQYAEAVLVLNDGLQRFPENADLLYARALAANSAGDKALMVDDLNRLIVQDPDNAHALNALGYHYADENIELELAEQLLVKANALMPEDPAIMDSLGWLRFRQGQYDESIELLGDAYKRFPDPEIAAHLAEALWLSGAQGKARDLIDKALQENPEDARLLAVKDAVFK